MAERPTQGSTFPDIDLVDHNGAPRRLAELSQGDPLVLHFHRGPWCPKERAFMRHLVAWQDELEVAYTRLVSVSVDPPEVAFAYRAGLGARWLFACDPGRAHLDALDLRELADTVHHPYVPAVFLLDPARAVVAAWDGYWWWGRPSIEELRGELRVLSRRLRPDFEAPRAAG